MKTILYEGINDPGIRKKFSDAEGLCNAHAYQLLALGDPLGHAIIYSDLLEKIADNMEKLPVYTVSDHKKCLFCESEKQGEKAYIRHFADSVSDDLFKSRYKEAGMICLGHYQAVCSYITETGTLSQFRETTVEKYRKLVDHMKEIQRKCNYRYADKKWTADEKIAWRNVVAVINGYPGMTEAVHRK
jgi:hypothetical protein